MPKPMFDHEKLRVYQLSVEFAGWAEDLLGEVGKKGSVSDQLDRASTSIPLNIAEGNGKYHSNDRCRYFDTSRGSALESVSCLDVLVAKKRTTLERILTGKEMLVEIVSMLVGLVRSNSNRLGEPTVEYDASAGMDQE